MKYLHELKEKLCEELQEIAEKQDMSAGDLEAAHKLTDTIKNIDKIEMLEADGYSKMAATGKRGATTMVCTAMTDTAAVGAICADGTAATTARTSA